MQETTNTEPVVTQTDTTIAPVIDAVATTEINTPDTKADTKPAEIEHVPMHRFKEVYSKMKTLERQIQENGNPAKETKPQTTPESSEPNWDEYQKQGKTVEEYNSDWVEHKTKATISKVERQNAEKFARDKEIERQTNAGLNFQKQAITARTKYADFDKVMSSADEVGISFPDDITLMIAESDIAGDLGYHLAKNHDDAYRVMTLAMQNPMLAIKELGRIESKIQNGPSQQPSMVTKAKPPIEPLNGNGKVVSSFSSNPNMSLSEFNALFPPQ